uniref:Uncharacterized protein n=1 Tax=Setaria viridis TaxID=4556 RepID=A0A4U6U1S7_SETVI|nr:hypothetical protein SEVIR_6G102666v2 [Setaria viridis]
MKKFVLMYLYAILLGSVTSSPLLSTIETGSIYAVKNLVAIWITKNMSIRVRRYVSTMAKCRSIFMQGYALSTF